MDEQIEASRDALREMCEAWNKRAELVASASEKGGRVSVTVDALGTIVETRFSHDVGELTYGEIASAITRATQRAAAEVKQRSDALLAAATNGQAGGPMIDELSGVLPDFMSLLPSQPDVSLAPPSSSTAGDEEW
ncbi:YbaB/EbfC family nucleoid-associated protein [Nocardia sp. NPDC004604]|uniref:YbaB/EbfC family nucleoid-associated protein n=1 Tax=Nocardia sp. NPDC004604 TaxID=3157013 RepID=UPI0033AA5EE8